MFLSLIGKDWLATTDTSGRRRLDDPADFVRIETLAALKRDVPIIPVLVQGATALKPDLLPDDLKDLAYRNAMELTHPRWESDVQLLINAVRPYVSRPNAGPESEVIQRGEKSTKVKYLSLAAVVLLLLGMSFYLRSGKKVVASQAQESTQPTTSSAAPASLSRVEDPTPQTAAPTFNTYSEDITLQKGTTTLFHGLTVTLKEIREGAMMSYDANGKGSELIHNSAYVTGELDGKAFDGWYKDGEVLHVSNQSCEFSLEFTLVYFKDVEIAAKGKCKE